MSLYVTLTSGRSIQSEEPGNSEFNDKDVTTYRIEKTEKQKIEKMAIIVDALEKLEVLDPNQKNCYTVDKIVKTLDTDGGGTHKVGIYLYIKEANSKDSLKSLEDSSLSEQSSTNSTSGLSSNSSSLSDSSGSGEGSCENLTGTPINLSRGSAKPNKGSNKVSSANSRTAGDASKTKHSKSNL